jgi:ribosomal protein L32
MSLAAVSGNFRVQKKNWARNFECDRTRPMRGSKRSGCPMRLKMSAVSKDNVDGPWQIEHTSLNSEVHNHSPSDDVRVHTAHRRRAAASTVARSAVMASFIYGQTAAGVSVAKIRAAILHRDPNSLVLPKDIGNFKMKTRNQTIATQTPTEALFSLLRQHNFISALMYSPVQLSCGICSGRIQQQFVCTSCTVIF